MLRKPYYQEPDKFCQEMDTPTVTLLRLAYNVLSKEIGAAVAAVAPEQRPSHGNVMEQLQFQDPMRMGDLADAAGITPQSMGELVDQLEEIGHVERRPDPTDRRAKLVYRTEEGKRAGEAAAGAVRRIEEKLVEELGHRTLETMRKGLADIVTSRGQGLPSLER